MRYICTLLLALLLPALSTAGDALPSPHPLSDHTWAWTGPYGPPTRENGGFRMNRGFVVGDDAVAVIDSGYGEAMALAMLAQIHAVTNHPVKFVINTNSQPHRIMGNPAFRNAGAEVLGLSDGSVAAPDRALEQETVLDLGGVTLRLLPVGQAHTAGSLVAVV